jgi:hypothetical protein
MQCIKHLPCQLFEDTKKPQVLKLEAKNGASEEVRTLDIHLGKVVLYQLSYARLKLTTE